MENEQQGAGAASDSDLGQLLRGPDRVSHASALVGGADTLMAGVRKAEAIAYRIALNANPAQDVWARGVYHAAIKTRYGAERMIEAARIVADARHLASSADRVDGAFETIHAGLSMLESGLREVAEALTYDR
jgi:hypothetical protein